MNMKLILKLTKPEAEKMIATYLSLILGKIEELGHVDPVVEIGSK